MKVLQLQKPRLRIRQELEKLEKLHMKVRVDSLLLLQAKMMETHLPAFD
jgi:hypothetical protein